jgi:Pyruvate/2-oxoacid:ferredoxin oxidoreductase gamma subunit
MVLLGAASEVLPLPPARLEEHLVKLFAAKGEKVVETNRRAFQLGRESVPCPQP